jgi:predicted nucleic acid-binding protein
VDEPPHDYLADTNVLSNRSAVERDPCLIEWLRRFAGRIRISVVTVAEMRRGLILLDVRSSALSNRQAKVRERRRLAQKQAWYDEIKMRFADRIAPIDLAVAEKWAETFVRFPSLRDADKALAATAMAKGYAIATENLGDFRATNVVLVNPFDPGTWDRGWDDDPLARLRKD